MNTPSSQGSPSPRTLPSWASVPTMPPPQPSHSQRQQSLGSVSSQDNANSWSLCPATCLDSASAAGKVEAEHVLASAPSDRNLCRFRAMGCQTTHSNLEVLHSCSLVFFATKPHILPAVLVEVAPAVTAEHILVSVAAGVSLSTLEKLLPPMARVLRVSPNLPCIVQEGAMVMARGCCAGSYEAQLLRSLLEACGQCEEVPEAQVDVHTGLSGSGVAFVCAFSEALAEGAIKMGMPSGLAHRIAAQTLLGTAKVLLQKGQHPAQLRTDVCTPGGTTIYGLHVLEQGGLRATAMSAVEAATCRARELSRNPSPVVAQVPSVLQALQGEGALAHREHSSVARS
uniref:Pyrroline-5-carboxylate reductase n=1 Tax=Bos taurus TaxID=9913 RepID=A0AAA9TES5_BOVIN